MIASKAAALGGLEYNGGGGYNVITWDPRGEFASGGQLQIDNPFYEGRDVSAIISWLTSATNPAANQVRPPPGTLDRHDGWFLRRRHPADHRRPPIDRITRRSGGTR